MTTRSGIHDAGPLPWVMRATGLTVATLLVASCGGDGAPGLPTVTPSQSVTATIPAATRSSIGPETPTPTATISRPTRPPAPTDSPTPTQTTTATTASPTRSPTRPETPVPVPTATISTATPTATQVTASPSPTPSESPTTLSSAAGSSAATTGVPTWLWWLLAALALATVIAVPLLVSARRRRAWWAGLTAAENEVAWFARVLIPELQQAGSVERVAGGWAVGSSRVSAVEDRLTALEASAPDDAGRTWARTLRDAVQTAREHVQELTGSGAGDSQLRDLDAVAAELEAALRAADQSE